MLGPGRCRGDLHLCAITVTIALVGLPQTAFSVIQIALDSRHSNGASEIKLFTSEALRSNIVWFGV